jgi:hypothetical protein
MSKLTMVEALNLAMTQAMEAFFEQQKIYKKTMAKHA